MKANFKIAVKGLRGDQTSALGNAIFNFSVEYGIPTIKYGYMNVKMEDVTATEIIFAPCGRKGLNKDAAIAVKCFVLGWLVGKNIPCYQFTWV
jgi:hypothetical protein